MEQIAWVQDSGFATWVRESSWAIFAALIVHTLSMGLLVGTGLAIDARVLGIGRRIPLTGLRQVRPLMAWALPFVAASGLVLVIGYPAKALTNPLFYAKLAILAAAFGITWALARPDLRPRARGLAALSLPLWAAGLTAGKFLAYTHKMLLVYS